MRKRLALLVSIAALTGFGLHAGGAGAVTFGTDLNPAANNPGTCAGLFGQSSCMLFTGDGSVTQSFYAPVSGTVNAVRVKTGNLTGAMQILVLTSFYQNNLGDPGHPNFFCCFLQEYGPTFTPAANSVTTVPASMTMIEQPTPASNDGNTVARGDFLALAVLAPNVPIPAALDNSSFYSPQAPAPNPSTTPAPSPNPIMPVSGFLGLRLLMNADITPGGGGETPGGPGAAPPVPQGNPLQIPSGGSLLGTTAQIPLVCVLTTACDGTLKLTNQALGAAAAAKKKKKKTQTYGSKKFSIPAGKTENIKVKLNAAGRKKLGKRKTLTVTATATVGSQTVTSRVKLRRHGKRK